MSNRSQQWKKEARKSRRTDGRTRTDVASVAGEFARGGLAAHKAGEASNRPQLSGLWTTAGTVREEKARARSGILMRGCVKQIIEDQQTNSRL